VELERTAVIKGGDQVVKGVWRENGQEAAGKRKM
jgi:hypothetical protein